MSEYPAPTGMEGLPGVIRFSLTGKKNRLSGGKGDKKRVRNNNAALFLHTYFFLVFADLEALSIAASFALAKIPFFFFGVSRGPLTPLTPVM